MTWPAECTDAVLMRRVQAGDVGAFGRLYEQFVSRSMGVAQSVCRDRDRAAEIVQDAFLAIWSSRSTYANDRGAVSTWVLGIVHHRAVDNCRRTARHRRPLMDPEELMVNVRASDDLESDAIAADETRHLRATVAALPELQRQAITLAYYGERTNVQIARELQIPLGTVKGRLRLGLGKLRAQIAAR